MTYNHKFGQVSLVCHAFNAKATEMAISLNSNDVFIFQVPQAGRGKFVFLDRLQQHSATVRSIDWAPNTDRIVSCSKDRNAYVWTRNGNTWKPTLVILQLNRAATFVRWSPQENKFAVGSGAKVVSVCCFEADNDFWVSKHIKKGISSTITCLDWHPDNNVLVCGSTDFKVRVYSAFLKSSDQQGSSGNNPWGNSNKFNTLLWEAGSSNSGWVHSVAFSADGNKLAWTSHASYVGLAVASGDGSAPVVSCIELDLLPLQSITWVGSNTFVGVGHNCMPFAIHTNPLQLGSCLDSEEGTTNTVSKSVINRFQNIDRSGESGDSANLNSVHQNTINEIRILKGNTGNAQVLTTVGRDGQLVLWDLKTLQQKMAQLKIC